VLIPLPIFLAVLVNSKITIGKNFFRSALFIPALTSVVVAGLFFRLAFGEQTSTLVNFIIGKFGFHPIIWLQGKHTSMFVLVLLSTWRWLGVNTIYFLSGLQGIPPELYEAASIDGANELQKFRSITLPGLKPIINFVFIISLYAGLAMFEESFILWPGQRSPNEIGLTIVGYIYQQGFGRNNMGYGSAIGITLFLVLIVINIFTLSLMGIFKKESD
jgi:arabinosaccharide transport system permease protein